MLFDDEVSHLPLHPHFDPSLAPVRIAVQREADTAGRSTASTTTLKERPDTLRGIHKAVLEQVFTGVVTLLPGGPARLWGGEGVGHDRLRRLLHDGDPLQTSERCRLKINDTFQNTVTGR